MIWLLRELPSGSSRLVVVGVVVFCAFVLLLLVTRSYEMLRKGAGGVAQVMGDAEMDRRAAMGGGGEVTVDPVDPLLVEPALVEHGDVVLATESTASFELFSFDSSFSSSCTFSVSFLFFNVSFSTSPCASVCGRTSTS